MKLMTKINKTVASAVCLAIISTTISFPVQASSATDRVKEVLELLEKNHVSGSSDEELGDAAIEGMLYALDDPYSQYFTEEEMKQFQNAIGNEYVGIGIRLGTDSEGIYIVEVFQNSPAAKSGIKAGDHITSVNAKSTKKMLVSDVIDAVSGKEGSSVLLRIQSGTSSRLITVPRASITMPIVQSKWLAEGVGYIELSTFSEDAGKKFAEALQVMKNKGLKSLVFDLRDNSGGYVDSALEIAKQFIKEGVLMHTRNKDGKDDPIFITGGTAADFDVVVLVNENSASASEILAGALQDYGVAKIIGTKTYGKGVVQSLWPLTSGGYLKITYEEYYTPNQHKVHKEGIQPNTMVSGATAQLITGLRASGVQQFTLKLGKDKVILNNAIFYQTVHVIREGKKVYVPSSLLAALVGGKVAWDAKKHAVAISANGVQASFTVQSGGVKVKDGSSYVNIDQLTAKFPQLHIAESSSEVTFQYSKGK